jgi:hypothetical protein
MPDQAMKMISIAHSDGLPPTACQVEDVILAKEVK